jgi:hypothetical protein
MLDKSPSCRGFFNSETPMKGSHSVLHSWRKLFLSGLGSCMAAAVFASFAVFAASNPVELKSSGMPAQRMTEIFFLDSEPEQPALTSRILILGERMRMDYGRDDQGFVLFDRVAKTVWHVSPHDRKVTGIVAGKDAKVWPKGWLLSQDDMPSGEHVLSQIRVNGVLCAEFKTARVLEKQAGLLADFRATLAANQAQVWSALPESMHQPCTLGLDVRAAGVEYRRGMPLAIRYWDGRSRVYQGYRLLAARPELFDLPSGYRRVVNVVKETPKQTPNQGKGSSRQPRTSQAR